MSGTCRGRLPGFVLALVLLASGVQGQTARTFEELQRVVRANDFVVVISETRQTTKGRVVDVSVSSLVVSIPNRSGGVRQTRTFAQGAVTEIAAVDPLRNGVLIGAAVGTGFAMWDYLIDPSEPGNAAIFIVSVGLGGAIGAGIDALTHKVLYRSRRQSPSVGVSPFGGNGRQGLRVNVRF
jgi:hypothetical protein